MLRHDTFTFIISIVNRWLIAHNARAAAAAAAAAPVLPCIERWLYPQQRGCASKMHLAGAALIAAARL